MHARPTQSAHSAITSYGNKRKILVLRVPSGARGPPCHQPITISLPKGPGAAWEAEGSSREGGGEGSQTFSAPFLSFWPHLAGIIGQISIYIIRCRWIPPPPFVYLMHAGRRGRRRGKPAGTPLRQDAGEDPKRRQALATPGRTIRSRRGIRWPGENPISFCGD